MRCEANEHKGLMARQTSRWSRNKPADKSDELPKTYSIRKLTERRNGENPLKIQEKACDSNTGSHSRAFFN
jgi:hypothetical protein